MLFVIYLFIFFFPNKNCFLTIYKFKIKNILQGKVFLFSLIEYSCSKIFIKILAAPLIMQKSVTASKLIFSSLIKMVDKYNSYNNKFFAIYKTVYI